MAHFKEPPKRSLVAINAFHNDFFKYTVTRNALGVTTGVLSQVTGATATACPAGRVLRENGKKLYPGANNGITTYMIGVIDSTTFLNGFINPDSPIFTTMNTDKPTYLPDTTDVAGGSFSGLPNKGKGVNTLGDSLFGGEVVVSGQVRSQDVTQLVRDAGYMTVNVSLGQVFKITLTSGLNTYISASNILPGSLVYLIITVTGTGGVTIQPGSPANVKIQLLGGSLTLAPGLHTIHFICDATNLYELGRTTDLS
jgi:hypothetical protein